MIGMFDAIAGKADLCANARGSASRRNPPCLATGQATGSCRPLRSQAVECRLADWGEVTGNPAVITDMTHAKPEVGSNCETSRIPRLGRRHVRPWQSVAKDKEIRRPDARP